MGTSRYKDDFTCELADCPDRHDGTCLKRHDFFRTPGTARPIDLNRKYINWEEKIPDEEDDKIQLLDFIINSNDGFLGRDLIPESSLFD